MPASIIKRLPIRYNFNDRWFHDHDIYEGIPINGYTPIFHSIMKNYTDIVKLMINEYNGNISYISKNGHSLLTMAAVEDNYKLMEFLIKKNININHQDIYGNTALIIADRKNERLMPLIADLSVLRMRVRKIPSTAVMVPIAGTING